MDARDKRILIAVGVIAIAFVVLIFTRHTLNMNIKEWLHFLAGILFGSGIGMLISLLWRK